MDPPEKFNPLKFTLFDGKSDPRVHPELLPTYQVICGSVCHQHQDIERCQLFLTLYKGKNETLLNYNKHYWEIYNEIEECSEELVVMFAMLEDDIMQAKRATWSSSWGDCSFKRRKESMGDHKDREIPKSATNSGNVSFMRRNGTKQTFLNQLVEGGYLKEYVDRGKTKAEEAAVRPNPRTVSPELGYLASAHRDEESLARTSAKTEPAPEGPEVYKEPLRGAKVPMSENIADGPEAFPHSPEHSATSNSLLCPFGSLSWCRRASVTASMLLPAPVWPTLHPCDALRCVHNVRCFFSSEDFLCRASDEIGDAFPMRSGRVSIALLPQKRRIAVLGEIRHPYARFLQLSSADPMLLLSVTQLSTRLLLWHRKYDPFLWLVMDVGFCIANEVAEETFSSMRTVRVYGTDKQELGRYKQWLGRLADINLRQSAAYGIWNLRFNPLYHSTQHPKSEVGSGAVGFWETVQHSSVKQPPT
ncbi:hypothetical protein Acr_07g0016320 [Actinidia rufa]|uniref:Uncharacterized protein n=1 Tax=Actinidia rufa TaxID=165716 RepID=A0A7J0EZ21_9ERIC|nr:hypothetical protein Acr_07g0016320 [Actinidia rufa]